MIDIKSLEFSYKNKSLYKDFDITFKQGCIYGLLGKNASGKTTLLGLISGNLFYKHGSINTLGYNPKNRDASMLSQIFYLPEQFILPSISAKEYVKLYSPFYPNFSNSKFEEYARVFEVESVNKLTDLSMGQQKKFLLSFGLATNSKLNLLDEPSNGLDIPSKSIFRKLIASCATNEKTFIISTHQIKDIENLIYNVCMVDKGQIALNQSIETLSNTLEVSLEDRLDGSEIYYEEVGLGRFSVLKHNTNSKPNSIDLELLFNATLSKKSILNEALAVRKNKEGEA